jgi:hypothetical protein
MAKKTTKVAGKAPEKEWSKSSKKPARPGLASMKLREGTTSQAAKKTVKNAASKVEKTDSKIVNDTSKVNEFMNKLEHPLKAEMAAVRAIIMKASNKIAERIKWNAPSFFYLADMAAFNPRATKYIQIIFIFPKGLINDGTGLLEGDWKDRREARFYDMEDVKSKRSALEKVVNDWIKLIDK